MDEEVVLNQLIYSHQIHPRQRQQSVHLHQMFMCRHEFQQFRHRPKIEGLNNDKSKITKIRTPFFMLLSTET